MRLLATRPAANAAAKKSGSSFGPRPMWASGSPAQASSQPSTSTSSSRFEPLGGVVALRPRRDDLAEAETKHSARVVRSASVTFTLVGRGGTDRDDGHSAERVRDVCRLGCREPAVPERRAGADDPGTDRAHGRVEALGGGPEQSRGDRDALDLRVETGTYGDRRLEVLALAQSSKRVGERAPAARRPEAARRRCAHRCRSQRRPARPGCAANSRRRASRPACPAACVPPLRGAERPGRARTGASSRAHRVPPAAPAHA